MIRDMGEIRARNGIFHIDYEDNVYTVVKITNVFSNGFPFCNIETYGRYDSLADVLSSLAEICEPYGKE